VSDSRAKLQSKFEEAHRFANFADALMHMHVQGFRCHQNTVIEIRSPITAFSGLNGTGKSTLLQLAAAAFASPDAYKPSFYINNFLVAGTLDPSPFTDTARAEYKFWQDDRDPKVLTISRRAGTKRWSGYTRRPKRSVFFAGVSSYLPWVEQRDSVARHLDQLVIEHSEQVAAKIQEWTCKILHRQYETMHRNTVSYATRRRSVMSVQRGKHKYSEAHMGYGEARSQFLIAAVEALPERSLILIEEPEMSLHQYAQYEFGSYLIDAATRRGHQIFLTTHSESLLRSLPSPSRVFLYHSDEGVVQTMRGLTALQAASLMAIGHQKALHILVEDPAGKAVLREILRKADPTFLSIVSIHVGGSASSLFEAAKSLRETGLPVAVVLDGDKAQTPKLSVFKLPGHLPPEKELFASKSVQDYAQAEYGVSLEDFQVSLAGVDHHEWCERLAQRINQQKEALVCELARAYVQAISEADATSLAALLREVSAK
jgi:predicted ATPase